MGPGPKPDMHYWVKLVLCFGVAAAAQLNQALNIFLTPRCNQTLECCREFNITWEMPENIQMPVNTVSIHLGGSDNTSMGTIESIASKIQNTVLWLAWSTWCGQTNYWFELVVACDKGPRFCQRWNLFHVKLKTFAEEESRTTLTAVGTQAAPSPTTSALGLFGGYSNTETIHLGTATPLLTFPATAERDTRVNHQPTAAAPASTTTAESDKATNTTKAGAVKLTNKLAGRLGRARKSG